MSKVAIFAAYQSFREFVNPIFLQWLSSTNCYFSTEYKNANRHLFPKWEETTVIARQTSALSPCLPLPLPCPPISLSNDLSRRQCWLSVSLFPFLLRTIGQLSENHTPFSVGARSIPLYTHKSFHSGLSGKGNLYLEY